MVDPRLPAGCRFPAVYGLKGHSLVFDTEHAAAARSAVRRLPRGHRERLPRRRSFRAPTGPPMSAASPAMTVRCRSTRRTVAPDPGAIERLEAMCAAMSPALARAKIVARQSCFRPVTAGRPAADRSDPRRRRRLCRHRPQRLGHPQRAGDRRGDGRADRRRRRDDRRSRALRPRPASAAGRGGPARATWLGRAARFSPF